MSSLSSRLSNNLFKKLEKIKDELNESEFDKYEILRSLKCLLKINKLLLLNVGNFKESHLKQKLCETKEEIENLIITLDKNNKAVDWQATAQVLLLCAWRSIKEACLYLGDFISKVPIETGSKLLIFLFFESVYIV